VCAARTAMTPQQQSRHQTILHMHHMYQSKSRLLSASTTRHVVTYAWLHMHDHMYMSVSPCLQQQPSRS
jgi:hypothetical protein